jgi:DNA-binding CsgD family transcriptional regulator
MGETLELILRSFMSAPDYQPVHPMEIRSLMHSYWLRRKSANVTHKKLEETYHEYAPSRSTVGRWFRCFSEGKKTLEDEERSGRPKITAMEKEVEDLVEEDPSRSNRDIAATLSISPTTVERILREDLQLQRRSLKVVPYFLSAEQQAERVRIAKEMLAFLTPLNNHHLPYLWTQDESWILFRNEPRSVLTKIDEPRAEVLRPSCRAQKIMVSIIWNFDGLWSLTILPQRTKPDTAFMETEVLGDWDAVVRTARPAQGVRGSLLHLDNAPTHKIEEELARLGVVRIPQPPYSPDLSPCDFHLFGYIKEVLQGLVFDSEDQLRCQIDVLMVAFNKEARRGVFEEWKQRLERCIRAGGARVDN